MRNKRFLAAVIAAFMIMSIVPVTVAASESITISAENTEVIYGTATASVKVEVEDNPGIAALSFKVGYDDEKMTLTSVKIKENVFAEADVTEGNISKNPYTYVAMQTDGDKTEDGILMELEFAIADNCEPGTYEITLTNGKAGNIAEDTVDVNLVNGSIKVCAKKMTGITFKGATYTYDGKEKEILVAGTLPEGAEVTYENNKVTAAGTYEAKATVTAIGYEELELSAKLKIRKKQLTIDGFGVENKTYDGTTDATLIEGELEGVVEGDGVEAVYPEKGTFAQVNAKSTVIAVAFDEITLTGEDAGNYTLKQPGAIKAKIKKAPITVTADSFELTVGDEIPELTYKITEGKLFGDDEITGALATSATTSKEADFSITKGTLKVSANYDFTFIPGKITVSEKPVQEITVEDFDDKTYGDEGFKLNVEEGSKVTESEIVFVSSNENVATIDTEGNITIKNAGKTEISVTKAGDENYAAFNWKKTLKVNKVEITVNAKSGQGKRIGNEDPELLYTYEGKLVGDDKFTGELKRKAGEKIGFYNILIGTLTLGDNYNITFNSAKFEITKKTAQTITLTEIPALTYGDAPYTVIVTKDATANLEAYTYESDNEDVLTIADGVITIKAAGEATIKVTEPGNDEYAASTAIQKVTVNKKEITVVSIDLVGKNAVITGILDSDDADLDFNKLQLEIGDDVDEATANATAKNFVLTGEKAVNYKFAPEAIAVTVAKNNVATVVVTADKGEIEGAGTYLLGAEITLKATAPKNYKFAGWYIDGVKLSGDSVITINLIENKNLTTKFTKKSSGGGGGGGGGGTSYCTVKFDTDGGSELSSVKVEYGSTLGSVTVPTREGYVFEGWFLDKEFTTEVTADTKVKGNINLYARWVEKAKKEIVLTIGEKDASVFGESKANDVAPVIRKDRTMLPARFVAEALGAAVTWNEEKREVTIESDKIKIVITIDSDKAFVNGKEVTLDSPAFIENDRTYTPVRFVAEALGASVSWDEKTEKVTIAVK